MWRENTFSMRSEQGGEERSELLIDVQQMSKIYNEGRENEVRALDNISLSVQWGEFLCILGQSGSGKSTLMNILGCLDIPTYGTYYLDGQPVSDMKPSVLAGIRNREIGFIFQGFNLIPALTAIENVELPLIYRGIGREERRRLAADALCSVGLEKRMDHRPGEMSGGQQQRVAIARAVAAKPPIIMADEPTGNLDSASGLDIMRKLTALNEEGTSIILITHDNKLAQMAKRIVTIQDGRIVSDRASEGGEDVNWTQTVRMALKSILNNKIRSLLTMLGIIIGVASVIAIVASIQGTTKLQKLQYEAMGANRIDVYAWGARNKDWQEFEEYLDSLDEVAAWSPQSQYWDWQNGGVQYRSKKMDSNGSDSGYLQMYFVNEHYGEVTSMSISAGRDLTEADCKSRARVCVIGETLRKYFFGAMSPIGQELRIGGKSFEIVGVYAGKYGGKLNTNDQMLIMPYTLQSLMMSSQGMSDHQYIIKAENAEDIQTLTEQTLPEFMQPRCEVNGGYFSAYSNSQSQQQQEASSNLMALLGGGIASISLLVGGIGIMNIMLVSVTERTREIGIRMAIGARKRDIIGQFLVEAAVVSCCGGIIGIVLGCFASAVLGRFMLARQLQQNMYLPNVEQFTVLPSVGLVLGAFLFSALLGIIFGLYPANKASNLQPVDALRTQ